MLSLEGAVTCAVVRKPIACVLHLSLVKFQQDGLKGCTVTVAWYIISSVMLALLPSLAYHLVSTYETARGQMVRRGKDWSQMTVCTVVRCGESGKKCLRPGVKNCHSGRCVKNVVCQIPSGVSLLYPKQCIAMEAVPCDHPVVFHEFCLCTAVGMSAKWGVPVPNLSLLVTNVVSCICIGMHWQSNQFQMT